MLVDPPALPATEQAPAGCIRLGWVNRQFRCVKRRRERGPEGGIITVITAREEAASMYTDLLTADYSSGTSITNSIQSEAPEPPTNLQAFERPFAIEFAWQLGAFWTLHGITELWESTTDSFGSATKVWEGRGTRYILPKVDVAGTYYWVRMRTVGGQVSATEPATNGVVGSMFINSSQRICVDAEVQTPDPSLYWSPDNGKATISAGGGVIGGVLVLAADGAAPNPGIRPIRPGGFLQATLGMQVKVRMRYRRTTSLTTTDASNPTLSIRLLSHQTATGGLNNEQDFQQISLAGLTLNQWYESGVTLNITVNTITAFGSARPYVNLSCFLDTSAQIGSANGTVEIDLYDAVIVA